MLRSVIICRCSRVYLILFLVFFFACCCYSCVVFFFFFKQKTAYEIVDCDWSSDVCSSDLTIDGINYVIDTGVVKVGLLFS